MEHELSSNGESVAVAALASASQSRKVTEIHTLMGRSGLQVAEKCLGSLKENHREVCRFVIHDDGTLSEDCIAKLQSTLGDCRIILRAEADAVCEERLAKYPNCREYRRTHVLGLKLFDIALFAKDDIRYVDSDIYFVRPLAKLFAWPDESTSALFCSDHQEAFSVRPWHLIGPRGVDIVARVNTGIIYMRRQAYDLDCIESTLAKLGNSSAFSRLKGWSEQTLWSILGAQMKSRLWSSEQIAVAHPALNWNSDSLVAVHFVSTFRSLLFESLFPDHSSSSEVTQWRFEAAERLTPMKLLKSRLGQRLRRMVRSS